MTLNNIYDCYFLFDSMQYFTAWSKIFKTSVLKENSILFDVNKDYGEDLCFVFNFLKYTKYFATTNSVYYYSKLNEYSATHKYNEKYYEVVINIIHSMNSLFEKYRGLPKYKNLLERKIFYYMFFPIFKYYAHHISIPSEAFFKKIVHIVFSSCSFEPCLKDVDIFSDKLRKETIKSLCENNYSNIVNMYSGKKYSKSEFIIFLNKVFIRIKRFLYYKVSF